MSTATAGVRIGFIGLGSMGAPMAKQLLEWPGGLTVCDTRAEAIAPFVDAGAESATSAAELAEKCAVVSVAVVDDAQVRQVVTGPGGLLETAASGTIIAVHSTISDSTAADLAARCAEHGVELIDAPVSGGAPGANRGELAVMVGGSAAAFARVREPFGCFSDLIVHAGPVGAGTRMKLARNLLHFVAFTAVTEAQRLAEAAGLDITTLGKVVRHSDAVTGGPGAIMLRERTGPIADGDFWLPIMRHVRDLGDKDLSLALDLGARLGVDLPLAGLAREHLGPGLGVPANDSAATAAAKEK
ncbi:NAD(P)-dependent oxidoreductase [Nocardia cyriacigeorgica]|uniref:NAD(P)-dependent oxidoreductase n=1 Tax=Nocardia cyriacigeorgica TaxID=135487 RepID=A0A6P1CZ93_9NOCA|nr:NAD(P)-dependent oxidoreductase [Nocardia cyriacigeorgica]NEW40346.1 NAD(P)-dependent oxidoreductase [Nocardia cyriacigeorgica]NEW43455.1 NAD(P)-dependent oxidoreductase [Nocardia cyriacigeorgica]NEW50706.1 NAD(P)-dependent oxidoreductase [Nocardia cyriacigeorgica]NEW54806.1 NAD(P)-dependent oxidoreductase [Nocardia cyriacigeorgica]